MQAIANLIAWFAKPIVRIFLAIVSPISWILWAFANPEGAANLFICKIIDLVALVLPSTPPQLKIGALISSAGGSVPIIGSGILFDVVQMIGVMLGVVLVIKVYKLIPFKAT
mgnify:CR=1 FL=1